MTLQEKIDAALAKVMENPTDENLKEYENLIKVKKMQDAQEKGVDLKDKNKNPEQLTDAQKFVKDLKEAMTNGGTLLVPTTIGAQIETLRYEYSNIRKYSTIHPCSGNYTFAVEGNGVTVSYISEGGSFTDYGANPGSCSLTAYKLGALVKISSEFLEDSAADIVAYITKIVAKGFALKEDHEFLLGSGSSAITGVVTAVAAQAGTPNVVVSATSGTALWTEVKSTIQKLNGEYRKNATIFIAQGLLDAIHEFKDSGKYIFEQNTPITHIMGIPVVVSPDLTTTASASANTPWMVVGDFSYYHIADRKGLEIKRLNETFAANDQVGFLAKQRIDGKPTVAAAFAVYYNKKSA